MKTKSLHENPGAYEPRPPMASALWDCFARAPAEPIGELIGPMILCLKAHQPNQNNGPSEDTRQEFHRRHKDNGLAQESPKDIRD